MRRLILFPIAMFCAACLAKPVATPTPLVELEVVEEPSIEPTATPDCQPADGVTLEVLPTGDSSVRLSASGLRPGEIPYVTFTTSLSSGRGLRIESGQFVKGANEFGNFSYEAGLSTLPEEGISATWDIRFTHSRGVECAMITLP